MLGFDLVDYKPLPDSYYPTGFSRLCNRANSLMHEGKRGVEKIFIDTSALLSLFYQKDLLHKSSLGFWEDELESGNFELFTSFYVLHEFFRLFGHTKRSKLSSIAEKLYQKIKILRTSEEDEATARKKYVNWLSTKADASYTDAVSFALMEKHGIKTAFSLDNDFIDAGFNMLPVQK